MFSSSLPSSASWRHQQAREGFEVAYFQRSDDGYRLVGCTTAVEDNQTWIVDYTIDVDATWATRSAIVHTRSEAGVRQVRLDGDGLGHWQVDGEPAPHLDGCLDVDLESSAMTNTLPVHRLSATAGDRVAAPAAYVRATDLTVQRLEQQYVRAGDDGPNQRYDYSAPVFEFAGQLVYDESGLVLDYPGIAVRIT
jgi:hypothetical protein